MRLICILVNQNAGQFTENLKLENVITLNVSRIRRKNFIFITYTSDSARLQNFIEIQGGHVNCYVDMTFIYSSLRVQRIAHLILFDLIMLIILSENTKY